MSLGSSLSVNSILKVRDLKDRLIFTLLALIVFRIGCYIPLPGINPEAIADIIRNQSTGMLAVMDMFSGGAISRMSIFALNISPYITSSIIFQLLSTFYGPLKQLRQEGEMGRKKINKYTRYLTVFMGMLQAIGVVLLIESMGGRGLSNPIVVNVWLFRVAAVLTLTGSVLFLMWLGEQITSRGIGNGTSLIIYAGIIAMLPGTLSRVFQMGREEGVYYVLPVVLIAATAVFAYVVFVEKAQLKLPIQYPKQAAKTTMQSVPSHLPLKVNMASVMPAIFAQSVIAMPIYILSQTLSNYNFSNYLSKMQRAGNPLYLAVFALMIIFFSFLYSQLQFSPKEVAENLKKSGAYIPGIRPGEQTAEYLKNLLYRLTVIGSAYLVSVCTIPQYLLSKTSIPPFFGGTTILIVVSVTIETISQIQSYIYAQQYKGLVNSRAQRRKNK